MKKYEGHTKAPWLAGHFTVEDHSCNCKGIIDEGYAGGIATIHVDNGIKSISDGGNDCPPLEEAKANARLIADAPILLEQNKRLREALGHIKTVAEYECKSFNALLKAIEITARHALEETKP